MNVSFADSRLKSLQEQLSSRGTARILFEALAFAALYVIGLVGNSLVLWVVHKKKSDEKMIYLFIGALAISDISLLTCYVFLMSPVHVLGKWPFSDSVCQFQGFSILFVGCSTVLLVAVTAVNRYFRVVRTNYYGLVFTPKRTKLLICATWVLAFIGPTQHLAYGGKFFFNPGKYFCFFRLKLNPNILFSYVYLIVPMFIVIGCYCKIYQTIRSHQVRITAMQQNTDSASGPNIQDIKITRTLFSTIVGFALCWTPILIIDIIDFVYGASSLPREVYVLYTWLGTLSSVINPFIYGAMNPVFRDEYKKLLRRMRRSGQNTEAEKIEEVPQQAVPGGHNQGGMLEMK